MKYKVKWMGVTQWADPAPQQDRVKPNAAGGIWLMVRSRAGGPFNRVWFPKTEVTKVDNTAAS